MSAEHVAAAHHAVLMAWDRHMTAAGLSVATRDVRVRVVELIARVAGVADPRELTADHVVAFLAASDYAAWTRRKYVEHLRHFARWAGVDDPTAGLRAPPRPTVAPRPIGEDDLARLVAAAAGPVRAWVLLGAYCGLRSVEIANVRAADVVDGLAQRQLRVHGKGNRTDHVPLPPVVDDELAAWLPWAGADGRLWVATPRMVQARIARLGGRIGVPVSSHQLRHRYGTALYAASHDLLLTQRMMRHSSPVLTMAYVQLDDAAAGQLALRLPGAAAVAVDRVQRDGPADGDAVGCA